MQEPTKPNILDMIASAAFGYMAGAMDDRPPEDRPVQKTDPRRARALNNARNQARNREARAPLPALPQGVR